jgi:hypothetical protein
MFLFLIGKRMMIILIVSMVKVRFMINDSDDDSAGENSHINCKNGDSDRNCGTDDDRDFKILPSKQSITQLLSLNNHHLTNITSLLSLNNCHSVCYAVCCVCYCVHYCLCLFLCVSLRVSLCVTICITVPLTRVA